MMVNNNPQRGISLVTMVMVDVIAKNHLLEKPYNG